MRTIDYEDIAPFDVDETLILHNPPIGDFDYVDVKDPLTGGVIELAVHAPMVRLLKEAKHRGSFVIVWSRGGYKWAEAVVKALELENHIDQVMSKPRAYYDDTPVDQWLKDRVYLDPNSNYKQTKE